MARAYRNAGRCLLAIGVAVTLVVVGGIPAGAGSASGSSAPAFAPDEIVVGYRDGAGPSVRRHVRDAVGAVGYREMPRLDVIELPEGTSVIEGLTRVPAVSQVAYAEPNYIVRAAEEPNDPMYDEAWSVQPSNPTGFRSGIDTPSAWNLTTGAENVTVAVVDSGVDLDHPDLAANIWTNPGESGNGREGNGTDDDENGFKDDWQGWDWINDDNDPIDLAGHGTMVAGTIGAQGNNGIGVSGVSWKSRLISLRVLDEQGLGFSSDAAAAFAYAGAVGADVVNASLTSPLPSVAMVDAIGSSSDTLFVVAAGNESKNNDVEPKFPCNIKLPNVMCVAATDEFNGLASFSNYGAVSVDLGAPGVRILTTHPDGYVEFHGSSAATPHVAGVAALLMARHPEASATQVADAMVSGVEKLPQLAGKNFAGGRLNAAGALRQLGDDVPYDAGRPGGGSGGGGGDGDHKVGAKEISKKKWCKRHRRHGHRHRRCRRR